VHQIVAAADLDALDAAPGDLDAIARKLNTGRGRHSAS
jgi:hypothetical protein